VLDAGEELVFVFGLFLIAIGYALWEYGFETTGIIMSLVGGIMAAFWLFAD
jgi:hypothetical protein